MPKGCESCFLIGAPWTLATGVLQQGCSSPVLRVQGLQHADMVIRQQHKPRTSWSHGHKQHSHGALTFQESYGANNTLCFLPEIDIMNRSVCARDKLLSRLTEMGQTHPSRQRPFNTVTLINSSTPGHRYKMSGDSIRQV